MLKIFLIFLASFILITIGLFAFFNDKPDIKNLYNESNPQAKSKQVPGFVVTDSAMEPTFQDDQVVSTSTIKRALMNGDVVIFEYPLNTSKKFIKRIVGIPGDKIEVKNGSLIVNDIQENNNNIIGPTDNTNGFTETTLSENEYFVMGDNRPASSDSRIWGPLKREQILWFVE